MVLDRIRTTLAGGDSEEETVREYECLSCGNEFEAKGPVEKVSCTRCGKRDLKQLTE